jgi:hypothetical protein
MHRVQVMRGKRDGTPRGHNSTMSPEAAPATCYNASAVNTAVYDGVQAAMQDHAVAAADAGGSAAGNFQVIARKKRGGENVPKVCSNCHQLIKDAKPMHPGGRGGKHCKAAGCSRTAGQGAACRMRGCPCNTTGSAAD